MTPRTTALSILSYAEDGWRRPPRVRYAAVTPYKQQLEKTRLGASRTKHVFVFTLPDWDLRDRGEFASRWERANERIERKTTVPKKKICRFADAWRSEYVKAVPPLQTGAETGGMLGVEGECWDIINQMNVGTLYNDDSLILFRVKSLLPVSQSVSLTLSLTLCRESHFCKNIHIL